MALWMRRIRMCPTDRETLGGQDPQGCLVGLLSKTRMENISLLSKLLLFPVAYSVITVVSYQGLVKICLSIPGWSRRRCGGTSERTLTSISYRRERFCTGQSASSAHRGSFGFEAITDYDKDARTCAL